MLIERQIQLSQITGYVGNQNACRTVTSSASIADCGSLPVAEATLRHCTFTEYAIHFLPQQLDSIEIRKPATGSRHDKRNRRGFRFCLPDHADQGRLISGSFPSRANLGPQFRFLASENFARLPTVPRMGN